MEEKHKCKLCSRQFSSGKAMGGHMRSHLMTLPLPPKTPPQKLDSCGGGRGSESTLSLSSLKDEETEQPDAQSIARSRAASQEDVIYAGSKEREENQKKSSRIVDPDEFVEVGSSSVVVHDRESETESTKNPTRRRSKRIRRTFKAEEANNGDQDLVEMKKEKSGEFEPVSSFSDTSPEEDIAICLMMLSKDVWKSSKFREEGSKEKYQCEICHKVLKSSQALGSHRTIHKNNNNIEEKNVRKLKVKNVDQKVHECPFCGKIYGSGQALGGHKRSHILSSSITGSSSSGKFPNGFIDLNMPAPMEDEGFSQQEVSGVS